MLDNIFHYANICHLVVGSPSESLDKPTRVQCRMLIDIDALPPSPERSIFDHSQTGEYEKSELKIYSNSPFITLQITAKLNHQSLIQKQRRRKNSPNSCRKTNAERSLEKT